MQPSLSRPLASPLPSLPALALSLDFLLHHAGAHAWPTNTGSPHPSESVLTKSVLSACPSECSRESHWATERPGNAALLRSGSALTSKSRQPAHVQEAESTKQQVKACLDVVPLSWRVLRVHRNFELSHVKRSHLLRKRLPLDSLSVHRFPHSHSRRPVRCHASRTPFFPLSLLPHA